eukprot:GAFH01001716.1.p2 GENE.GAFH01001716.1~~GAFH01001716.1.p2  ORF type:complete len:441 (+),score=111.27 GAFH01001716.1:180-1325(+)
MICVSGDNAIELQNGTALMGPEGRRYAAVLASRNLPPLLDYTERRKAHKKVIASRCRCFASRGYPRGEPQPYAKPYPEVIVVTAAGPQFENDALEWKDFIIDVDQPANPTPLFPSYYRHSGGAIPAHSEILDLMRRVSRQGVEISPEEKQKSEAYLSCGIFPVVVSPGEKPIKPVAGEKPGPIFFNAAAYFNCMVEDIELILTAFARMVDERNQELPADAPKRKGYFKFVAIGCGFFAQNRRFGAGTLSPMLYPLMLAALQNVLTANRLPRDRHGQPLIDTIELPDFSGRSIFTPSWGDEPIHGISINKGHARDALDFTREQFATYWCGCLNAGDCFCIPGNERQYASVEAAIGNNTDMRIQQAYFHNPQLLDLSRYVPVD